MRRVIRNRRWQPVFIRPGARRRIFFYSGVRREGAEAFFHHHHGDARPHLHLSESSHKHHQHHHEDHSSPPDRVASSAHRQVCSRHRDNPTADQPGHWHFSLTGAERLGSNLLQFIALQWASIWAGSQDQLTDTAPVVNHWARPPPQ
jgi:hypothetical protein